MFLTKNMGKWLDYSFDPVENRTGKDFNNFSRNLKTEMKAQLKGYNCEIIQYSKGYFYINGFIRSNLTGEIVYFSIPDLRYEKMWYEHILIRKAKDIKDFRGGINHWTKLDQFGFSVQKMFNNQQNQVAA